MTFVQTILIVFCSAFYFGLFSVEAERLKKEGKRIPIIDKIIFGFMVFAFCLTMGAYYFDLYENMFR